MRAADALPMWIDARDALARIALIAKVPGKKWLGERLTDFHRDGYTILKGAVLAEAIDAYIAAFDEAAVHDPTIMIQLGRKVVPIIGQDLRRPLTKILDTHVKLPASLPLVFAAPVMEFAHVIFNEPALAFQGLHFETGSTQRIHQDTAYVVLDQPKKLIAAWIALEDVREGSGELEYYPGSHRFDEFLYPGDKKHWDPSQDSQADHDRHMAWLDETATAKGIKKSSFLARKGDVLIWHADLAHGGSKIRDPALTRRSLVIHYAPASSEPNYFRFIAGERRRKVPVGRDFVSSMYYDIDDARLSGWTG